MSSAPHHLGVGASGPTTQVTPAGVQATGAEAPPQVTVLYTSDPELVGRSFPLTSGALVLGRGVPSGGLSLADPTLSRQHARIQLGGDRVLRLHDLSSRNGSFVNGERVEEAPIRDGDLIRIGDNLLLLRHSSASVQHERRVELAAHIGMSVLLQGETGTGKEITARKIHTLSARSGEFVALNCGAVPAELITAELFGHAKGAFSGATQRRKGVFRAADGGTLLLDEIGDCPPQVQVALLRALEQRAVRPVGEEHEIAVQVQVIAATHRNLKQAVEAGEFRADLYARLAQYVIYLPPLRERRAELLDLARELANDAGVELTLSVDAAEALLLWEWPFNIRELRSLVGLFARSCEPGASLDRAYLQEHFPALVTAWAARRECASQLEHASASGGPGEATVPPSATERAQPVSRRRGRVSPDELLRALEDNEWSPERTAQSLGIPKSTVHYLMRSHPGVRRATDIGLDELREALEVCDQDVDAAAARLRVSARALAMHMRRQGLLGEAQSGVSGDG